MLRSIKNYEHHPQDIYSLLALTITNFTNEIWRSVKRRSLLGSTSLLTKLVCWLQGFHLEGSWRGYPICFYNFPLGTHQTVMLMLVAPGLMKNLHCTFRPGLSYKMGTWMLQLQGSSLFYSLFCPLFLVHVWILLTSKSFLCWCLLKYTYK